jgi:hypothetical protein
MVEEKPNGDWALVFPQAAPDGGLLAKELDALSMLDAVMCVYKGWVEPGSRGALLTHNVSATVVVRPDEVLAVQDYLWEHRGHVAAISFAPYLVDKKFPYAPREAVVDAKDEAYWNDLIRNYRPVDWGSFTEDRDTTIRAQQPACSGGNCES